jgi:hypothetical protein
MSVDPSDPETFQQDDDAVELPIEAPEADAAEQHAAVRPYRDTPLSAINPDVVDEADAIDQARVVELDEDDYA